MFFFYVLFIAYILAINAYAFMLVRSLKDKAEIDPSSPINKQFDGKLALTGVLGGAIAIYVSMFVFKYRLSNLFLMILMPLLGVLNIFLFFSLFRFKFFIF